MGGKTVLVASLCALLGTPAYADKPEPPVEEVVEDPWPAYTEKLDTTLCKKIRPWKKVSDKQFMKWYGKLKFRSNKNRKGIPKYNGVEKNIVRIQFRDHKKGILVHKRIAPVYQCVSMEIDKKCSEKDAAYSLGERTHGYRKNNSYRKGLSKHLVGVAIDINPGENPMSYKRKTDIPKCWQKAFKKYGFIWGGNTVWRKLETPITMRWDTMHFQYYSSPKHVEKMMKKTKEKKE